MPSTILCIDDDAKALDGLRTGLEGDVRFLHTADLEEAFEVLTTEQPDLVVVEVQLKRGNGLDLVERMRRAGGDAAATPVIVVTRAGRTPGVHGRATDLGVGGYFTKPAPARQLVETARALLEKDRPAAGGWDGQLEIGSGRLADLPLAELLDRVHRRAESGVLIVGDSTRRTGMQIRNGSPVAVTLPEEEEIDAFLVRTGRISARDRDEALGQTPADAGGVESVLLDSGLVDEETLDDAFREQADEAIFRLFELSKGRYRFEPGRRLKGSRSLDVTRSAESFIVRGVLAWTPIERVRGALGRYGDLYATASPDPDPRPDDVPFSEAQRDFVEGLVGDRMVEDFLDGSEFELRTLYAFAILGAVGLTPEPMLMLDEAMEPVEAPCEELVLDEPVRAPLEGDRDAALFDPVLTGREPLAPDPDVSFEEDLFEQRAFEEDSFEKEMVAEASELGPELDFGDDSLVDFDELAAPEDEAPLLSEAPRLDDPAPPVSDLLDAEADDLLGPPEPSIEFDDDLEAPAREEAPTPPESEAELRRRPKKSRKRKVKPRRRPEPAAGEAPVAEAPPASPVSPSAPAAVAEPAAPAPSEEPIAASAGSEGVDSIGGVSFEEALAAARASIKPRRRTPVEEPAVPLPERRAAKPASEAPDESEATGEVAAAAEPSPTPKPAPAPAESARSASGGYEIAPLGSINTDPKERAEIAQRVQKRLDRRYAQLTERAKPEAEAGGGTQDAASRALEAERWFRKGSDLLKAKKYAEAVEAFGMSAHHDPSEGEYVAHLGYALYLSKPDDETVRKEALEDIARGIKLSPDRELPYVYLGRVFKVQGELDNARKMFRRALKIRPHCRLAQQELRLMEMRDKKKNSGLLSRFLK